MKQMLLNVIHRADRGPSRLETLRFQQDEAHRNGLRTTILVTYSALFDRDVCEYVAAEKKRDDVEVGLHLHELVC
ncbi:MAG TPA: hypothetical protein VEA63_00200, partial [Opitutus sp.]|nr:hypothetical protein [Opitutus sp.]